MAFSHKEKDNRLKYANVKLGEIEYLLNLIGGPERLAALKRHELILTIEPAALRKIGIIAIAQDRQERKAYSQAFRDANITVTDSVAEALITSDRFIEERSVDAAEVECDSYSPAQREISVAGIAGHLAKDCPIISTISTVAITVDQLCSLVTNTLGRVTHRQEVHVVFVRDNDSIYTVEIYGGSEVAITDFDSEKVWSPKNCSLFRVLVKKTA